MDQYRADKGKIFQWLRGKGTKVLNGDDETYEAYSRIPSERTIVYSVQGPGTLRPIRQAQSKQAQGKLGDEGRGWTLCLSDIAASPTSTSATLHVHADHLSPTTYHLDLPIPGTFNLENALCAIACASAVGVEVGIAAKALETFHGIPGRLERIDEGQTFSVFVDYTVTPVAHEKTLHAVRATVPHRRLLVLTGSCGDRMREKRPIVGRIASSLADVVVITTDETYTEDPRAVMEEVWAGVDSRRTRAHKIPDRMEAITFLLREAQAGDAVVLCGMGCCTTRMTRAGQIPWDERAITREILRRLRSPA